jgi:hypothetical protein
MPLVKLNPVVGEGKFTQEGGGGTDYNERIQTL